MKIAPITKAVFPVAGWGTRFLPATKANPKEMLSIVDKPLIQYAVDEAVQAGITELIFVTNACKRAIEDHFDSHYELEAYLEQRDNQQGLATVRDVRPEGVTCIYIRQPEARGLGHAVLCAQTVVGAAPFAVILADDLIHAEQPCLAQMLTAFERTGQSVVAVQEVAPHETSAYGIIDFEGDARDTCLAIRHLVEKPVPEAAPSQHAVIGRYLLTPTIFDYLEKTPPDQRGEIQLTDAIRALLHEETVTGYRFTGQRYDCGSKLGFLQATIAYGLRHPEIGADFKRYLARVSPISP